MIKRMFAVLLTVVSLCSAAYGPNNAGVMTSDPMFAYAPFPMEGLSALYRNTDGHTKYAYAPYTVQYKGAFHQFYCSNGQGSDNFFNPEDNIRRYNSKDHIRYRSSKDGVNWSAPRIVMTVSTKGSETCACDPSVVKGDDGYWYMLYTSEMKGYFGTVVLLARSKYVHGPYFRYMEDGKWENEGSGKDNPKVMLGTRKGTKGVIGQQSIVKLPGYNFWVWYTDLDRNIRFTSVESLTGLKYEKGKNDAQNPYVYLYFSEDGGANYKLFKDSHYIIGDVRFNSVKGYFEMWCPVGYMMYDMKITKFMSHDGVNWLKTLDNDLRHIPNPRYSYIHNIGVAGDEYGRIYGDKYLVSFAAPSPNWSTDFQKSLNACSSDMMVVEPFSSICKGMNWESCKKAISKKYGANYCASYLEEKDGFNIRQHRESENIETQAAKGADMGGKWSVWQQLVGADWHDDVIDYNQKDFRFPQGVESKNIDYFTGDYDGDGIADLGAVDKSTHMWYLYSSRRKCYMDWKGTCKGKGFGEIIIKDTYDANGNVVSDGMTDDFEIIAGDYDGDGKTDIGAVDKRLGRWYIYSSRDQRKGVYSSLAEPNYIPWGWQWGGMSSGHKIVVGDYDGDGIADRAIYADYESALGGRRWFIISSRATEKDVASGFKNVYGWAFIEWGWLWPGMEQRHVAISGDFDGDGITDRAIYGTDDGKWSSFSSRNPKSAAVWRWGLSCVDVNSTGQPADCLFWGWDRSLTLWTFRAFDSYRNLQPITGDFDGDGVDDLVQVNLETGEWFLYGSLNQGKEFPDGRDAVWDKLKDAEMPVILIGDFDGDGKADRAFADKATRKFYVISSRTGSEGFKYTIKSVLTTNSGLAKSAAEKPIEEPKAAPVVSKAPSMNVAVDGKKVTVTNVEYGSKVAVFDMLGKRILEAPAGMNAATFKVPTYGKYIVRAGAQSRVIMVK